MRLIVGLGNPGPEYQRTRHNAGFLAVDRLLARHRIDPGGKVKFHGLLCEGSIAGERCLLLKPMTYMNHSGLAVGEAAGFYKVDLKDILVLVDDVALPLGRLRLRGEGSPGGHNGLADVQRALGSPAYARLRLGIDPPGRIPQVEYVLGRFSAEEWSKLDPALDAACDCVECWLKDGLAKAMTRFNGE